jgi:hypothetical protein
VALQSYVVGMLTNFDSLPLDRIHNMLKVQSLSQMTIAFSFFMTFSLYFCSAEYWALPWKSEEGKWSDLATPQSIDWTCHSVGMVCWGRGYHRCLYQTHHMIRHYSNYKGSLDDWSLRRSWRFGMGFIAGDNCRVGTLFGMICQWLGKHVSCRFVESVCWFTWVVWFCF